MPPGLCLDKHPARPDSCCVSVSSMVCGLRWPLLGTVLSALFVLLLRGLLPHARACRVVWQHAAQGLCRLLLPRLHLTL